MNTRPATFEDYEFVYEVKVDALKEYVTLTWGWDENVQRKFHQENFNPSELQIICHEGRAVGFLAIEDVDEEVKLNEINLMSNFQRLGIGTGIILEILQGAAEKRKPVWLQVLKVNPAIRLYERLGFKVYDETDTHYQMKFIDGSIL